MPLIQWQFQGLQQGDSSLILSKQYCLKHTYAMGIIKMSVHVLTGPVHVLSVIR